MKTLLGILMVLLVMAANVQADPNDGLTTWGLTADGADHLLGLRIGWEQDNIELFGSLKWLTAQPDWGPSPDLAGIGMVWHINEFVAVEDALPDSPWEAFLHAFLARPYVGVEGLIPTHGEQRTPKIQWLVGTLISTDPEMRRALAIEYASGQGVAAADADSVLSFGLRIKF